MLELSLKLRDVLRGVEFRLGLEIEKPSIITDESSAFSGILPPVNKIARLEIRLCKILNRKIIRNHRKLNKIIPTKVYVKLIMVLYLISIKWSYTV